MYVIRDKNAKSTLYLHKADVETNLSPGEVYPEFDPHTMEMGKLKGEEIPPYFDIDAEGWIVAISEEQQMQLKYNGPGGGSGIGGESAM